MFTRSKRFASSLAALLVLGGCDPGGRGGEVRVSEAWVRLPAAKNQPGAAYFRIEGGAEGARLVGVSSPLVRWVELHETVETNGTTRMRPRKEFDFPSRGPLLFEPGGRHAMLSGMNKTVVAGSTIPLTFSFNTAPPVTVDAEVRGPDGESHDHGDHEH